MKDLLISIVMPFKNTAQFLPVCLNSILKQTENNWELIAVNDHSTDESNSILQQYNIKDKRIKVFQNKGNGIIDALRMAYANSYGNLITRMDADDVMPPNKLKILKQNLLTHGKGHVALGLVKYFSEAGIGEGYHNYELWLNSLTIAGKNFDARYKECVIPSPCWMVYRDDFDKCGAFNSSFYPEDYDLTFRFYENHLKCIATNEVLHFWRDYPTRTSRTHEHYADSSFIEIKIHYFLKLDYQKNKNLVVWGAGSKGKQVAKLLLKAEIPFHWICDNPKKIGKKIYSKKLWSFTELDNISNPQSIVTVANPKSQKEIKEYFNKRKSLAIKDYFFFC